MAKNNEDNYEWSFYNTAGELVLTWPGQPSPLPDTPGTIVGRSRVGKEIEVRREHHGRVSDVGAIEALGAAITATFGSYSRTVDLLFDRANEYHTRALEFMVGRLESLEEENQRLRSEVVEVNESRDTVEKLSKLAEIFSGVKAIAAPGAKDGVSQDSDSEDVELIEYRALAGRFGALEDDPAVLAERAKIYSAVIPEKYKPLLDSFLACRPDDPRVAVAIRHFASLQSQPIRDTEPVYFGENLEAFSDKWPLFTERYLAALDAAEEPDTLSRTGQCAEADGGPEPS